MNVRLFFTLLSLSLITGNLIAATSTPAEKSAEKKPTAAATKPPEKKSEAPSAGSTENSVEQEAPTQLPQIEVKKGRISDTDRQIQEKEKEIAREKKNTKSSEIDEGLNSPKVSGFLSIFGGASSEKREKLAKERVGLLEFERELTEQLKHAKTKEEKQALKKQLNELRAMRRELESSNR